MVPEIFLFFGSSTRSPDFQITTFICHFFVCEVDVFVDGRQLLCFHRAMADEWVLAKPPRDYVGCNGVLHFFF